MIILMPLAGAALYRLRGSPYSLPRPLVQAVIALPFSLMVFPNYLLALLILLWSTAALCLGHAQWQQMKTKGDFFGMLKSGALVTALPSLILCNPFLLLAGMMKAPCYVISWRIVKGTWLAECLFGAVLWGSAAFFMPG